MQNQNSCALGLGDGAGQCVGHSDMVCALLKAVISVIHSETFMCVYNVFQSSPRPHSLVLSSCPPSCALALVVAFITH